MSSCWVRQAILGAEEPALGLSDWAVWTIERIVPQDVPSGGVGQDSGAGL